MNKSRILVTCPKAVPPLLAKEVEALDLSVFQKRTAAVVTEGTLADCMRLNMWVRTGHRVHYLLTQFNARNADELYDELVKIPWEDYIREDGYFTVTSTVSNPTIRDTRFAGLKCKDAICDRIRETCGGIRPDSGAEPKGVVVYLYWKNSRGAIYLDTSGVPLSKRGYRRIPLKAPMQETLAASVILQTGWNGRSHFVNPMCGSGTLAIEAALIASGRAPGLTRRNFGFMHIKGYDQNAWTVIRNGALTRIRERPKCRIIATDIDPAAVAAAKKNAEAARVVDLIEFSVCDFADTKVPEGEGVVIFNPAYGERIGDVKALIPLYRRIGDFFKRSCSGYRGYVFTGNEKLFNKVSLRPSQYWTMYNSNIECRLLEYEIY